MSIGQRIKQARTRLKLTQGQLADISGVKQQMISKLETGRAEETADIVELAAALKVTPGWLRTGEGTEEIDNNVSDTFERAYRYPVVSSIQAGLMTEVTDLNPPGVADQYVESTYRGSKGTFALRVDGDSMVNPTGYPSFPEGIIIIADPSIQAVNGSFIVARLNGSMEATFKQLVIDGTKRYLKPLNPRYPLTEIIEECQICGVVKAAEMRF